MKSIKFSHFETNQIDFIVFNSPNQENQPSICELNKYIDDNNIVAIFRLCQPLYQKEDILCEIIDLEINDGTYPDNETINKYLSYIEDIIQTNKETKNNIKPCIGIHCKAGLGRAPIFAAIGLMNYTNNDYSEVVKLIRSKINGSINAVQLKEISDYNPKKKNKVCSIM
jgi:protein tyrosine phosphatase type 4A